MKRIESKIFGIFEVDDSKDVGIFKDMNNNLLERNISHLYISKSTLSDDDSINKTITFFDNIDQWNQIGRQYLEESNDEEINKYFDFYIEEVPEVFKTNEPKKLTKKEKINSLILYSMASHGSKKEQKFVLNFTLGYDQILCLKFDTEFKIIGVAWES
ncbi:MAG: hypothetical protein ACK5LC_05825 [Coprobacillaceae bacterium]